MKKILLIILITFFYSSVNSQTDITVNELKDHIFFLTSEKNAGRYPGGRANKIIVKYLEKDFKKQGLLHFGNCYKQNFKARFYIVMELKQCRMQEVFLSEE